MYQNSPTLHRDPQPPLGPRSKSYKLHLRSQSPSTQLSSSPMVVHHQLPRSQNVLFRSHYIYICLLLLLRLPCLLEEVPTSQLLNKFPLHPPDALILVRSLIIRQNSVASVMWSPARVFDGNRRAKWFILMDNGFLRVS